MRQKHYSRPLLHLLFAVSLSLCTYPAAAQYLGPNGAHTTVTEILQNPTDDQSVILQGYIVKRIGHEKFLFSDGKNQIQLEIEAKYFPPQPIDEKTLVEITGEVEKDFMEPLEIEVKSIRIITPP